MVAKLENECQNLNKTAHRSDLNIEFKKNRKYLPRSRQHVYASCQTFLGEKRNEIVDKTLGDVWRVWLNSSPSATSQQMMDTWTGMLDRLWGETGRRSNFEYIIHLFLSVWQRPIHFTCGSQQHLFETAPCRVTSRSETTRTKDDGHLKQTRLDYIGLCAGLFFTTLSIKMGDKLLHFCCRDRVLSVWMTSSFQYFRKKGK